MICRCEIIDVLEGTEAQQYAYEHLKKAMNSNWEIEYLCPDTGIQWLMDFPNGEYHGGGPPRLRKLLVEKKLDT